MAWMARLIRDGQKDVRLRMLAEKIVRQVWPHDYLSEYAAILNWARANIRYTRDPRTIEQLSTAAATAERGTGDCDDLSVFIGVLVGQIGGQVRLVAAGFNGSPNGSLSHVWLEAFDPVSKSWVVLDPVPGRKVHEMLGRVARTIKLDVLL